MSKKELLNTITAKTKITNFLRYTKSFSRRYLPILAYHRILDYDDDKFDQDIELVSSSLTNFENQISYISKNYTPISFKELANTNKLDSCSKPPVIITFDDGFYDNYEYAYPILKKYNVTATYFIITNVIDMQEPIWFDLLAYLIMTCDKNKLILSDGVIDIPTKRDLRRKLVEKLLLDLRNINNQQRKEFLSQLIDQTNGYEKYIKEIHVMSWSNIREMSKHGMEFGSHSVSHPILAQMNNEEIDYEVRKSKQIIENQLDEKCYVFAYPVGGFEEFNQYSKQSIIDSDYNFACTYEPGINKLPLSDPYQLRRIHVERYTSLSTFKNLLISSVFGYK